MQFSATFKGSLCKAPARPNFRRGTHGVNAGEGGLERQLLGEVSSHKTVATLRNIHARISGQRAALSVCKEEYSYFLWVIRSQEIPVCRTWGLGTQQLVK